MRSEAGSLKTARLADSSQQGYGKKPSRKQQVLSRVRRWVQDHRVGPWMVLGGFLDVFEGYGPVVAVGPTLSGRRILSEWLCRVGSS